MRKTLLHHALWHCLSPGKHSLGVGTSRDFGGFHWQLGAVFIA